MRGVALLALAAGLLGCHRAGIETEPAVRQALQRYLASRPNLNMSSMDLEVTGLKFRQRTAEADVTFRAKGDTKAVMSIRYTLRRQGNAWEVEPQSAAHGGMTPPVGSPAPELPAGHPPVKTQ